MPSQPFHAEPDVSAVAGLEHFPVERTISQCQVPCQLVEVQTVQATCCSVGNDLSGNELEGNSLTGNHQLYSYIDGFGRGHSISHSLPTAAARQERTHSCPFCLQAIDGDSWLSKPRLTAGTISIAIHWEGAELAQQK